MGQKRLRDYGVAVGRMAPGPRNKITDVPGVAVGHCTVHDGDTHTGVTVIVPGEDNPFVDKYTAAAYVHNGFGKSCGLVQIEELGTLETPIALTNTLCVGRVWDALAGYMLERCEREGVPAVSINPVVGECNDSRINRIAVRAVKEEHLRRALAAASADFVEGSVGAGTGTLCHGLKGGIGSASRVVQAVGRDYFIGVLVQSNYGATEDFVLNGEPLGLKILEKLNAGHMANIQERTGNVPVWGESGLQSGQAAAAAPVAADIPTAPGETAAWTLPGISSEDKGSIMTVLATDLPLTARQLRRVLRRTGVGIARTGGYTGHGSGEVMIGFTTANRIPSVSTELLTLQAVPEETLNRAFLAAAEAEQEAILNSMVCAAPARGLGGEIYHSLAEFL